ncbi:hypothetical protein GKR41_00406 [Candidatus Vallotia lariciata]|nr:hypothetical protein GKR41_00406 [Candidatus Vallotia lariciata]
MPQQLHLKFDSCSPHELVDNYGLCYYWASNYDDIEKVIILAEVK